MNIKIFFLVIILLIFNNLTSFSSEFPQPTVDYGEEGYHRYISTPDSKIEYLNENGEIIENNGSGAAKVRVTGAYTLSNFKRTLGFIKNGFTFDKYFNITDRADINFENFSIIRYYSNPLTFEHISIFEKTNEICIGYYIIDFFEITRVINEPIINKIKSLPIDSDYLLGKYTLPSGFSIVFYKTENQNFIERYGILEDPFKRKFLYLDSFYPKEMEKHIESYLIDTLNSIRYE